MYWNESGMNGGGYILMTVGVLAFLGLLGVAIVVSIQHSRRPADRSAANPSPEQLLGARFARGEIDEDEYTNRLRVLRGPVRTRRFPTGA